MQRVGEECDPVALLPLPLARHPLCVDAWFARLEDEVDRLDGPVLAIAEARRRRQLVGALAGPGAARKARCGAQLGKGGIGVRADEEPRVGRWARAVGTPDRGQSVKQGARQSHAVAITSTNVSDVSPPLQILGCPIHPHTQDELLDWARDCVESGEPHRHVCMSAAKLQRLQRDSALRRAVISADRVSADGMGVLVAARSLGLVPPPRVTGIALFLRLARLARDEDWGIYLLGARPGVAFATANKLQHALPGLRIVGTDHGFHDDDALVAERIRQAAPQLLFVAMGTPRQELFQHRWAAHMQVPLCMGVGGSFDVVTNDKRRAPPLLGDRGLEWLYRFVQEPGRLWRRNLLEHGAFLGLLAKASLSRRLRR